MRRGQVFSSFDEFQSYLKLYETENKQKFVIRSSRSIETARKILKRSLDEKLKYYEAHFTCIHGGKLRIRGKGLRKTRTHKMDCSALIKIRANKDGVLEIKDFLENHSNHGMERCTKQLYLKNQRLSTESCNTTPKSVSITETQTKNIKSISQKRKKALFLTNSLANLASLSNISLYNYRMKILQDIEMYWRQGIEVVVHPVSDESQSDTNAENIWENDNEPVYNIPTLAAEPYVEIKIIDQIEDTSSMDISDALKITDVKHISETVISNIKLLPTIKTKGRPRDAEQTVIGNKRKRKCTKK